VRLGFLGFLGLGARGGIGDDGVIAQVLVDDAGADVGHLGPFGELVDDEPDRSILAVVEEAGAGVLSSCAEGICGTCETAVLDGLPDHRDSVLTEEERRAGDCMMICVSRSCTERLVLDL
jgi:ferredoxin